MANFFQNLLASYGILKGTEFSVMILNKKGPNLFHTVPVQRMLGPEILIPPFIRGMGLFHFKGVDSQKRGDKI